MCLRTVAEDCPTLAVLTTIPQGHAGSFQGMIVIGTRVGNDAHLHPEQATAIHVTVIQAWRATFAGNKVAASLNHCANKPMVRPQTRP